MPQPSTDDSESVPCFEDALAELEAIVHELEEGQTGLAEALSRYEQGIRLLKQCYGLLENAQRRIEVLTGIDADGNPTTEPFAEQAPTTLEEKSKSRSQRRSKPAESRSRGSSRDVDESTGLF